MVPHQDIHEPNESDALLASLVRLGIFDPEATNHSRCFSAVLKIVSGGRPQLLPAAIRQLGLIASAAPWALPDWCKYQPDLEDIAAFAGMISRDSPTPIPPQGLTDYPVLAALRPHSNLAAYDNHARALLVSLAIRLPFPIQPSPSQTAQLEQHYPCITVLSSRIRGLNLTPSRNKRGVNSHNNRDTHVVVHFERCLPS